MAKLAVALILFNALFMFSGAELPFDDSPSITLAEPEMKKLILLPSEKPETEPATMVELEQYENEKMADTEEIVEEEEDLPKTPPRTAYRDLRPVWLHRDVDQRMMMFVLRHHRCHHPYRRPHPHQQILFRQFDVDRPETERTERYYGNDMLVVESEPEKEKSVDGSLENDMLVADPEMEKRFDERALEQDLTEVRVGDGRRHAPLHWVGLHFGGPHRHSQHHHHEHRPNEERRDHHQHRLLESENRQDEEDRRDEDEKRPIGVGRREENGGSLMKRFRKFLHKIDL